MSSRRSHLVLLLVAFVASLALSTAADVGGSQRPNVGKVGEVELTVRGTRVDAPVAHLTETDHRDSRSSERPFTFRLTLVAIVAAALGVPTLRRCRGNLLTNRGSAPILSWRPQTGRAPPSLQLLSV